MEGDQFSKLKKIETIFVIKLKSIIILACELHDKK